MAKRLVCSLLVLFFLVQVISAVDTEITVKTFPNHQLNINFLNPSSAGGNLLFDSFNNNSGESGEISFVFSSNELKFDITAFVMKSTEKIVYERFDDNTVGESLYLTLFPGASEIIRNFDTNETNNTSSEENSTINETLEENLTTSEVEESGQENESALMGSTIFGGDGFFSKKTTYYGIGVIVLLLTGFIVFKILKKKKKPKEIKVKKLSELMDNKKEELQDKKEIIEDAERKIKEAQEDIRKIKNEDKIKEAKKKLIEDEKELVKLREGKE